MDWFECTDGYPTDESLERLRECEFDHDDAADFLVNQLSEITEGISCCSVNVVDGKGKNFGKDVKLIEFYTGGWSGAEDLINVILDKTWLNYFHTKWERGGHFYFEVPDRGETED